MRSLPYRGTRDARRGVSVPHEQHTNSPIVTRVTSQPGPDGIYRDCVIREPHLDLLGRPIYVALNADGCELDRMVAVDWEHTEKVLRRLWECVYRARENRLRLVP